jgi:hypothetical protein
MGAAGERHSPRCWPFIGLGWAIAPAIRDLAGQKWGFILKLGAGTDFSVNLAQVKS